jgi:hypothetical protein
VPRNGRHLAVLSVAAFLAVHAAADPLVFDAAQRERMDLLSVPVEPGFDAGEVDASGRVLDPQPLIDAAVARAAANSIAERSGRELVRVRSLNRGAENASARELELAEDTDRRARLDAEAAQARFAGAWGRELSERKDLAGLLTELRRGDIAVARIDIPAGVDALAGPTGLRVAVAMRPERALAARILGPTPGVDPILQGIGWFVLMEAPPPVGTALTATLAFADGSFEGVVVLFRSARVGRLDLLRLVAV